MASSRVRTVLGIGLVLIGSLFLLRALAAPIAFVATDPLAGRQAQQFAMRAQQQAQIEMRRAELEVERARLAIQRELREQPGLGSDLAPLPPLPALPPAPPAPPAPAFWRVGAWLNPAMVLFALLLLVLWRRSRGERAAQ